MTPTSEPLRLFEDPPLPAEPAETGPTPPRCLQAVTKAARLAREAQRQLATSVLTARNEGHSWRRIGEASRISHQTLHRRFASVRSAPSAAVSELD